MIALATLVLAFWLEQRRRLGPATVLPAIVVGGAVVLGWWFNAALAGQAFEIVPVQSVTFSGSSADTLMVLIAEPEITLSCGLGLVPGVFAGSFLAAITAGEFRVETFTSEVSLPRYIVGAVLMGFGSMLAGGWAVGADVTVMALTAWLALLFMWLAVGITDLVLDRSPPVSAPGRTPSLIPSS